MTALQPAPLPTVRELIVRYYSGNAGCFPPRGEAGTGASRQPNGANRQPTGAHRQPTGAHRQPTEARGQYTGAHCHSTPSSPEWVPTFPAHEAEDSFYSAVM